MSLTLNTLSLISWRNFKDFTLKVAPGLTVLVGLNATGKTNTIEAIQYLTSATSFRKPSPSELILEGTNSARINGVLSGDGRHLDVEMRVEDNKRRFYLNNKVVSSTRFTGNLLSILFNPDDLLLIKGSASHRREELDNFGNQVHSSYKKVYSTYMRSIEQRNHLLKDGYAGVLLDSWDESVALGAATLIQYRLRLFDKLKVLIEDIYFEISKSETLTCEYISSLSNKKDEIIQASSLTLLEFSRDELAHSIQEQFYIHREEDLRRGQTTIGPHRDDVIFKINNKDARKFGSQGQQRSIVLAWKMAEVKFCEQVFNSCPLLLLDDVMSELDIHRRSCITNFINTGIQTVVTTTNLEYFNTKELKNAQVVRYEHSN